jgi:drug/metabolite transporter (DMT)-like permease
MLLSNRKTATFLVLFAGGVWGISFALLKWAAQGGLSPLNLVLWQMMIVSIILLLICVITGKLFRLSSVHWSHVIVITLAGNVAPNLFFYYAAEHVPSGVMAITIALVPMMTYALAFTIQIESYSMTRFLGIFFGFGAILCLILPETSLPDPTILPWVLIASLAGCCYTLENLYVDCKIDQQVDFVILLTLASISSVLILIPINFMFGTFEMLQWPLTVTEYAITSLAVVNVICYLVFLFLIRMSGSVFASQMGYIVTLSGVGWGILLFGESHSFWVWLALVLMLIGMAMVTPRNHAVSISSNME